MEHNLAIDRDSSDSYFGDQPESQTGMHITCGMHNAHNRHTIKSHTFTDIHTCTHTHYVNTNLKVLADVHDHCT